MPTASPDRDPYAPPPVKPDRSGALVRAAVILALVAGAGFAAAPLFTHEPAPMTAEAPERVDYAAAAIPSRIPDPLETENASPAAASETAPETIESSAPAEAN